MNLNPDLPRWNLEALFPGLYTPQFSEALAGVQMDVEALEALYDAYHVAGQDPIAYTRSLGSHFGEALDATNALHDKLRLVQAYVHGHVAADSRDEEAQARQSEIQALGVRVSKLSTRLTAWAGALPLDELEAHVPSAEAHDFALRKMAARSRKLMSAKEEALASEMIETGSSAWSKLYGNYTSQIQAPLAGPSGTRMLPMSGLRSLAYDPDPEVRRDAYEAELEAWRGAEVVEAAAFNAIKGEANLLSKKRGWATPLDEALFNANIDAATLQALLAATQDALPIMHRYLRAKARFLGNDGPLPWWDLFAPVAAADPWSYSRAAEFVQARFSEYSPRLGDMAARAFSENWVDVPPRVGKRDGAFCMGVRGDESRVLMNFKPSFGSVSTLAHELGHAYHNVCLAERTALQRSTPPTLAETASIFCETVVKRAALGGASDAEALSILEGSLQSQCQVVVDVYSRFLFEKDALAWRQERDVSARELCELMLRAQEETYGEAVNVETLHPYMWAVKPHYYGYKPFYNFPYMFGLLFGLGIAAVYEREPQGFMERYDDLLSSTGMADAATLGARFGIDVRDREFWDAGFAVIEQDVKRFEQMVESD